MFFNLIQLKNAFSFIRFTLSGRDISSSDMQFINVFG